MKKLLGKIVTCLFVVALAFAIIIPMGKNTTASAATKRTAVVTSLLTQKGKVNKADWNVYGEESNLEIANNGKVFQVTGAVWPGYRIFTYDTVPANESYYVEFDVLKTNPQTAKVNLSGYVTNWGNGASSNIYLSSVGIDVGAGTNYGANGDGSSVWNAVNSTLDAGYRYRFWFRINPDDANYGDLIIYRKSLAEENAQYVEGCVLYRLCSLTQEAHYAHVYFEGDITIDNFSFIKSADNTVIYSNEFNDTSTMNNTGVSATGVMYYNGGKIVADTYLRLAGATTESLVTYLKAPVDTSLSNVLELSAGIKVASTAGKAGIAFGMSEQDSAITDEGVSYVYFENTDTVTQVNAIINGVEQTAVALDTKLSDDFHELTISGKSDGSIVVSIDGAEKATFAGANFDGYVGILTDGNAGVDVSFLPDFTVDTYKREVGTGADIANNFNTGYINPDVYVNEGYPAVSLGDKANNIVAQDGILKFDGTSDGTVFGIEGVYADFIMQFDWINYAWADRPTAADGTVYYQQKPASGLATELYSPLCVSIGKSSANAMLTENKLLRFFDGYNLIQMIDKGVATNVCMGSGFTTSESCADIQEGKIAFYENTVNIKIVAFEGSMKVYGVVMNNGQPDGEHKLLAEFAYENCTGYIAFATGEAGYFGIDNLRLTKIDGWTQEQIDGYENFVTIADEKAPEKLTAPVATANENVVSWAAVANASGYVVNVNGTDISTPETSYMLSEDGEYTITVKAIGDGVAYLDSDASAEVKVTVGTPASSDENDSTDDSVETSDSSSVSSDTTSSEESCFSIVGTTSVLMAALPLAGLYFVRKRKENE